MIKLIIVVVVALITVLLIYAATRPDSFRIERTLAIQASPEKIFPLINNFHEWEAWSPWEKIDPAIKRTYSGELLGDGAIYEWSGNKDIGQGRMEIIQSIPSSKVMIKIDFITPMEAHNTIEFTLEAEAGATKVTQAMYGPSPYLSRVIGLFFNMDNMIGQKFEEGLVTIKAIAEKQT